MSLVVGKSFQMLFCLLLRSTNLALLKAVGLTGRDSLQSVGFDMRQSSYERAFPLLDDTATAQLFVVVSHTASDDGGRFLG